MSGAVRFGGTTSMGLVLALSLYGCGSAPTRATDMDSIPAVDAGGDPSGGEDAGDDDACPPGVECFTAGDDDVGVAPPGDDDDAGPSVGPCVTTIDCAEGLVCGYDAIAGCGAAGRCVAQVEGPAGPTACGCDGTLVQFVAPGFTAVPVASPVACGLDAGGYDAGDSLEDDAAEPVDPVDAGIFVK